jgi:uncharacterized membrane protein YdfJ with MMPL/SSD domain
VIAGAGVAVVRLVGVGVGVAVAVAVAVAAALVRDVSVLPGDEGEWPEITAATIMKTMRSAAQQKNPVSTLCRSAHDLRRRGGW